MKFLLILSLALFSCSKSDIIDPLPTPPAADSIYLSKFFTIDTTLAAPADTIGETRFAYDAQKRLKTLTMFRINAATGTRDSAYIFTYTYNGNDSLPAHIYERQDFRINYKFSFEHFLIYNASRRLSSDSSRFIQTQPFASTSVYSNKYIYNSTGFTDSTYNYLPSVSTAKEDVQQTRDAQGNVTRDYVDNVNRISYDVTYDGHVNPLYRVSPVKEPYFSNATYPTFLEGKTPQKSNFTRIVTSQYNTAGTIIGTVTINYAYTYKSNGLPLFTRQATTPAAVSDKFKYYFVYTN